MPAAFLCGAPFFAFTMNIHIDAINSRSEIRGGEVIPSTNWLS